jgi:hypothetical protein
VLKIENLCGQTAEVFLCALVKYREECIVPKTETMLDMGNVQIGQVSALAEDDAFVGVLNHTFETYKYVLSNMITHAH